jgi:excisionase family DNA binding protein
VLQVGKNHHGFLPMPINADQRLTFTVPETGRLLGISRGAAYAAAADRTIPTIRVGRRLLVPRAALARLLDRADEEGAAMTAAEIAPVLGDAHCEGER